MDIPCLLYGADKSEIYGTGLAVHFPATLALCEFGWFVSFQRRQYGRGEQFPRRMRPVSPESPVAAAWGRTIKASNRASGSHENDGG